MGDDCSAYLDRFNKLLSQATDRLTCDSDCQKQRQADELQQKYASLASCSSSSGQAQEAKKIISYLHKVRQHMINIIIVNCKNKLKN